MSSTSDTKDLPKAVPKRLPRKALNHQHHGKEVAIERRGETAYAKARREESIEEEKEKKIRDNHPCTGKSARIEGIERSIDVLTNPDSKKTDRSNAMLKLRTLDNTLVGRQLLKQALAAKGINADTYAEMIVISRDVGKGEGYTVDKDGNKVPVAVDPQTALKARQHVTDSIEKVENADRREEDKPPRILVVVGIPFKDASDAIDKRSQGHQMGSAQWSNPGDEESG